MLENYSTEIWRPIDGYPRHEVSSFGRIRHNCLNGKLRYIVGTRDSCGYPRTWINGRKRVHQLVAEAFLGPIPPDKEINHIDGNRANPRLENLEIVSHRENMLHAVRLRDTWLPCKGSLNVHSRLSESQVKEIRASKGKVPAPELARLYSVTKGSIHQIWRGHTWKHVD